MIDNRVYYSQQPIIPVNKKNNNVISPSFDKTLNKGIAFNQVLSQEMNSVKFSQHAMQRLETRNIKLGQNDVVKLNDAVEKAAQKGAKESLVFMSNNNLALVVSVKNKTVITVMDGTNTKDNVFTNIDSAVIV